MIANVFDDPDVTGGDPAIPANATSDGTVDIAVLAPGTVVTVITKSKSKWVLTVQEGRTAKIQHYVWFFGAHYAASDILEQLRKLDEITMMLNEQFPLITLETKVRIGGDDYSGVTYERGMMPLHVSYSDEEYIAPFSAGDTLRTRYTDGVDVSFSGKILFWSID